MICISTFSTSRLIPPTSRHQQYIPSNSRNTLHDSSRLRYLYTQRRPKFTSGSKLFPAVATQSTMYNSSPSSPPKHLGLLFPKTTQTSSTIHVSSPALRALSIPLSRHPDTSFADFDFDDVFLDGLGDDRKLRSIVEVSISRRSSSQSS